MPLQLIGAKSTLTSGASPGVLIQITDSANQYKYLAAKNFKAVWKYKVEQEYVSGTNNPFLITQGFSGEITLELLYSTELGVTNSQLGNFLTTVNGAIPAISFIWLSQDTQPVYRTFTLTNAIVPDSYTFTLPGEKTVTNELHLIMSSPPAIT